MYKIVYVVLAIFLCISCVSVEKNNPYQNMEIKSYNENFAYEFRSKNKSSNALIIDLEGSGWGSTLGLYVDNEWLFTGTGAQLIQILQDNHTILILEKWDRVPGVNYIDDLNARYIYTKENLVEMYVSTIDSYLIENNYDSVFLVGTSEGAAVLPLVYENMKHKNLVKGIVSMAAGGLSMYESYLISIGKDDVPEFWVNAYSQSIEMYENIEEYYESIETTPMGLVYRQMASFIDLRPFEYYKNINIPILFIHGKNDFNIAVESTIYIQNNLPEKPFDYIYYDMGHIPMNDHEILGFQNDIKKWVIEIGKKK